MHYFYFYFFLFFFKFFSKKKFLFLSFLLFQLFTVSIFQPKLIDKYIPSTLTQFGILDIYTIYDKENKLKPFWNKMNFSNMNYISEEHQKLIISGIEIFKENPITGTGIKTYHRYCKNLKEKIH